MSLAIAIMTEEGLHIGFLLLAPHAAEAAAGDETGDCIFRSLPARSEDFTHELAGRLYGYQQRGELEYRRSTSEASTLVTVVIDADLHLQIDLDAAGQGSVSELRQGGPACKIGLAEAAKPR